MAANHQHAQLADRIWIPEKLRQFASTVADSHPATQQSFDRGKDFFPLPVEVPGQAPVVLQSIRHEFRQGIMYEVTAFLDDEDESFAQLGRILFSRAAGLQDGQGSELKLGLLEEQQVAADLSQDVVVGAFDFEVGIWVHGWWLRFG